MSKYQRLTSSHGSDANAAGDGDGQFLLAFENGSYIDSHRAVNHNNTINNNNNHHHNNNNIHFNSNNNNYINNSTTTTTIDTDEHTIDVPLLNHNHSEHDEHASNSQHDHHNHHDYAIAATCHCNQPGFSANLESKSTREAKFKILLAISLCCVFMIIEFLGGYLAGSLAIMADAAHLASDCISFVIGLVAIWLGSKPPDGRMSFGYKRMEVMGAIVSILGIWILTATLVSVAFQRISSNDFDLNANTMMTISGIGILINIAMVFILHGSSLQPDGAHGHCHGHGHGHGHAHHAHAHAHHSPQTDYSMLTESDAMAMAATSNGNSPKHTQNGEKNMNLRAAMIHVIGDLVQSVGVFLASILIKFYPSAKIADPLCTLLFSIIVIMTTVRLFKESVRILMDAVPQNLSLEALEMDLSHIDGVRSVHHLNVWNHTSNYRVLMAHLVIELYTDSNTVLERATTLAQSTPYDIKHCTIQIERLTL